MNCIVVSFVSSSFIQASNTPDRDRHAGDLFSEKETIFDGAVARSP